MRNRDAVGVSVVLVLVLLVVASASASSAIVICAENNATTPSTIIVEAFDQSPPCSGACLSPVGTSCAALIAGLVSAPSNMTLNSVLVVESRVWYSLSK